MAKAPNKTQIKQRQEIDSIFGGLNDRELAKKTLLSRDWLFQRLKDPKIRIAKMARPEIGKLYLYTYDAKWKDVLPYWDTYPVTCVISLYNDGFAGANFHYLPRPERLRLFKILTEQIDLSRVNPRYALKITYNKLLALGNNLWKPTWHRYLYSYMRTKLIEIPPIDWQKIINLPIAMFNGAGQNAAWAGFLNKPIV